MRARRPTRRAPNGQPSKTRWSPTVWSHSARSPKEMLKKSNLRKKLFTPTNGSPRRRCACIVVVVLDAVASGARSRARHADEWITCARDRGKSVRENPKRSANARARAVRALALSNCHLGANAHALHIIKPTRRDATSSCRVARWRVVFQQRVRRKERIVEVHDPMLVLLDLRNVAEFRRRALSATLTPTRHLRASPYASFSTRALVHSLSASSRPIASAKSPVCTFERRR